MSETIKTCQECDEDIHPKRLKLLPNTTLCVECAQDLERRKASFQERNPVGIGQEWLDGTVEELEESIDG